MERKLIRFSEHDKKYTICFAYYDDEGRWVGKSETAELTEEQLYDIFKPVLKVDRE